MHIDSNEDSSDDIKHDTTSVSKKLIEQKEDDEHISGEDVIADEKISMPIF